MDEMMRNKMLQLFTGIKSQLRGHTAGNFGVGNDKAKMYSVVEQCMPYIGYPRSLNAMAVIDEVAKSFENV